MNQGAKRLLLRWLHIILTIPIFGYIFGPEAEVGEYAGAVRYVFVPIIVLSGLWMYAGPIFALLGVAALLGAYQLWGYGAAVLSQVLLFLARKIWLLIRARSSKTTA